MRTEREPNRYEPLNETHRRVAEEEEKRRLAEQEQARSAQSEPEPLRPETEPRPRRPEAASEHDPEARLAAKEQELREQVRLGRIKPSEMIHQLRQFDDKLRIEIEQGGISPLRDRSGAELENTQGRERADDIRDQPTAQGRDDPSQQTRETRIEVPVR